MLDPGDSTGWDFLSVVSWWNLYGLPLLLLTVAGVVVFRSRSGPRATPGLEALTAVRRIGLIHYGLTLRASIQLTQELLTWRAMGIFQSNPINLLLAVLAVAVNPLLGLGLRRPRPRARYLAIGWYVLWLLVAILATAWIWHYRVPVDPADWPDHVVGKGMPLFLLLIMLSPRAGLAFAAPREEIDPVDRGRMPSVRPVLSLLTLLLLIVVISTLAVDAADWIRRLVFESDAGEPPGS